MLGKNMLGKNIIGCLKVTIPAPEQCLKYVCLLKTFN